MLALVALAARAQGYIPMLEKENVWKIHTLFEPNYPYEYSFSIGKATITDTMHVSSEYTSEWKVRCLPKEYVLTDDISVLSGMSFPYDFYAYDSVMVLDTSKEEVYKICTNPEHEANGLENCRGAFILTEKDRKVYLSIIRDYDRGCSNVYHYLIYDFNVEEGDIVTVTNAARYADNINHSRESYLGRRHYSGEERMRSYDAFYPHNALEFGQLPYMDCLLYRCWFPSYIPADHGHGSFSSAYPETIATLYCAKVEEHFIAGKNRRCLYFIRINRPYKKVEPGYYYPWYEDLYQYNSYICWIEGIGSAAGIMFNVNNQENRVTLYDERGVRPNASWIPTYETLSEGDKYAKCELVEFNGEPIQLDLITGFKEDWERGITACGIAPALQEIEEKGEGIYDLSGRRLHEEPASGVYIRNGKKYIKR